MAQLVSSILGDLVRRSRGIAHSDDFEGHKTIQTNSWQQILLAGLWWDIGAPCFPQQNLWLARCASRSRTALKKDCYPIHPASTSWSDLKPFISARNIHIPSLCWCLSPVPPATALFGKMFAPGISNGSSSRKQQQQQQEAGSRKQEAAAAAAARSSSKKQKQARSKQEASKKQARSKQEASKKQARSKQEAAAKQQQPSSRQAARRRSKQEAASKQQASSKQAAGKQQASSRQAAAGKQQQASSSRQAASTAVWPLKQRSNFF